MQVSVHIDTEVLDPEGARRKAIVWLLMNVGNLLRADDPELILQDGQLSWRCDVLLTRIDHGIIGTIGRIHIGAIHGEIIEEPGIWPTLNTNAIALLKQNGIPIVAKDAITDTDYAEDMVTNVPSIAAG